MNLGVSTHVNRVLASLIRRIWSIGNSQNIAGIKENKAIKPVKFFSNEKYRPIIRKNDEMLSSHFFGYTLFDAVVVMLVLLIDAMARSVTRDLNQRWGAVPEVVAHDATFLWLGV
ncbi:hypothetical protein JW905_01615 [bacterium]|nr:hypothetical protein [candidate division CSSED10-310 bacterium]